MGQMESRIRARLEQNLAPLYYELVNESDAHNVPSGSETHFKLVIVSSHFESLGRVARQRLVNEALREEFASGLHALTLRTLTPAEWDEVDETIEVASPPCFGGEKKRL